MVLLINSTVTVHHNSITRRFVQEQQHYGLTIRKKNKAQVNTALKKAQSNSNFLDSLVTGLGT